MQIINFYQDLYEKIFKIINLQKNKIDIVLGNIKTSINKKNILLHLCKKKIVMQLIFVKLIVCKVRTLLKL